MSEPIIKVENLSKRYQIGQKQAYYSLRDEISSFFQFGKKDNKEEFWALKDVNFEVKRGESVGIIGRNGSGKSTLLKVLSRITPPTTGKITMRGRVASLLEVGTGFNPELTGRENIFLNGAILGMTREEIKRKFDEIVTFAEIEKFLDTPVKRYSSGMYMRLAFSVAAYLESEILIVDEVLAVGDAQFQKKCLGKMNDVTKNEGRTVLFVSHNMEMINELCNKAMLLNSGKLATKGVTKQVVDKYIEGSNKYADNIFGRKDRTGMGNTRFASVKFNNGAEVLTGEKLEVDLNYLSISKEELKNCRLGLTIKNAFGNVMFMCNTEVNTQDVINLPAQGKVKCIIPKLPLSEGNYFVDLFLEVNKEIQDLMVDGGNFVVSYKKGSNGIRQTPVGFEGKYVLVDNVWKLK